VTCSLLIRGVTWQRDSHGLFDYESRQTSTKSFKTQSNCKLIRNQNALELQSLSKDISLLSEEAKSLCQIRYDDCKLLSRAECFYLENLNEQLIDYNDEHAVSQRDEAPDRLWLVIRSLRGQEGQRVNSNSPLQEYKIEKFDTIKLGRVKFRIKDKKTAHMQLCSQELLSQELKEAKEVRVSAEETPECHCRFCWENWSTVEDPLITPCKCAGSVGLLHYSCLCKWLEGKVSKKTHADDTVTSYSWKSFECEICKQAYPYSFKKGGKLYKLFKIDEPRSSNYLVLESLPLDKNTSRMVHVLSVTEQKKEFHLGRGHESEVRVNDISVSRLHATIRYNPDGFTISDNKSKFGSLVLVRGRCHLALDQTQAMQVGRSVVSFTLRDFKSEILRQKEKQE